MGLFDKRDKKRKDDFDSPMESIDLGQDGAERAEPRREPEASSPAAASAASAPARTAAPPALAAPPPPDSGSYGIDKAIELMRTLPTENISLVVQVVKFSLESVGIKLPDIIEDATRRQQDLRGRVDVLKAEITDLEAEIKQRKAEIDKHEADYKETTTVRERLELAEGLNKAAGAPAAATATEPPRPVAGRGTVPPTVTVPPLQAAPSSLPKK
jgi:hypothetical protein